MLDIAFGKGFSTVWLCPLFVDAEQAKRSSICCQVFCAEYYAASNKQVSFCSFALDKKFSDPSMVLGWTTKHFPFLKVSTCMLASEKGSHDPDFVVVFKGQESCKAKEVWAVSKYLQAPVDIADRIRSGKDESRWFPSGLWEFLIEKGLYRNK
jgi:hypothetical protein